MASNKRKNDALNMEDALSNSEAFIFKYKNIIIGAIVTIILVIAGIILYNNYVAAPREEKASTLLYKGQEYMASMNYDKALNGDGMTFPGFISIASNYSSTDAGNLANLYAGLCYAHKKEYQNAVKYLEGFDTKNDQMISPAAVGALGNCYAQLNQPEKAAETLEKAAKMADNNTLSPTFLIQAGEVYESINKKDKALVCYKTIKEKYVQSMAYQTIDKYIERLSK